MTVRELIEVLSRMDPDAEVLEESHCAVRILHKENIRTYVPETPEWIDEDKVFIDRPMVVLSAWS